MPNNLLLIDQDEFLLLELKESLRRCGYTVWAKSNIVEAHNLLKELPDLNYLICSFELIEQNRDMFSDNLPESIIPIVLLAEENIGKSIDSLNVYAYISKPVNFEKLLLLLNNATKEQATKEQNRQDEKLRTFQQVEEGIKRQITAPLEHISNLLDKTEGDLVGEDVEILKREFAKAQETFEMLQALSADEEDFHQSESHIQEVLMQAVQDANLPEHVEIEWEFPNQMIPIKADSQKLSQVFQHVFQNSNDAMNGKGLLHIQVTQQNEKVKIAIIDQGKGLDFQQKKRVFDPFFTSKNKTGLGLNIALDYVRNMGGNLMMTESIPNQGTTILIELPLFK